MAMNHRRYIAWYRSTTQVVFGTWRAANSRPYMCNTSAPVVPTVRDVVPRPPPTVVPFHGGGRSWALSHGPSVLRGGDAEFFFELA